MAREVFCAVIFILEIILTHSCTSVDIHQGSYINVNIH